MSLMHRQLVDLVEVKLTPQEMTFVIAVLDETVNQLSILRHGLHGCVKVPCLKYVPLRKRLGIDERKRIFGKTFGIGEDQSGTVGNECAFLEIILLEVKKELITACSFISLTEAIVFEAQLREDLNNLIHDLDRHMTELEWLMNKITRALVEQSKGSHEKLQAILHIKNEVHDLLMLQRLSASFTAKWEHTRHNLNKRLLASKEDDATQRSDGLQKSVTTEIHTHAQYSAAIDKMIVDLENDIIFWTKKRELDSDEKEQQILNLKIDRSRNQRHLEELNEEYTTRQAEIDEFLAYKKAKLERIELEKLLSKMATRIQAWWRGILCRKRLRAKKRKGKKGKKGQKRKGKKKQKKKKKK